MRGKVGAKQFQADAVKAYQDGRPKLLEFAQKHRRDLEDQLGFVWELKEAAGQVQRMQQSRAEVLLRAAEGGAAECKNPKEQCWCAQTYEKILEAQGVNSPKFRHAIFTTLDLGRVKDGVRMKGNAIMLVGGKDTGKSTITDPLFLLFKCFGTPPATSTAPLMQCRGHELFLWQDFRYAPGKPGPKEERGLQLDEGSMNRLLEGLPTLVEVPKNDGVDFVFDEDTPFIATGPFKLVAYKDGEPDEFETDQLTTRPQYFRFPESIPKPSQKTGFAPCPRCWAKWLLHGEIAFRQAHGKDPLSTTDIVDRAKAALFTNPEALVAYERKMAPASSKRAAVGPPATPPRAKGATQGEGSTAGEPKKGSFDDLTKLMAWRQAGLLSLEEFEKAKQQFFGPPEE